jgi:hypothetical protein
MKKIILLVILSILFHTKANAIVIVPVPVIVPNNHSHRHEVERRNREALYQAQVLAITYALKNTNSSYFNNNNKLLNQNRVRKNSALYIDSSFIKKSTL